MANAHLPRKLSDLILLALDDLAKVERSKKYQVNMGTWHDPNFDDQSQYPCQVCFAGAVIAKTLRTEPNREATPEDFPPPTSNRLLALDALRSGNLYAALLNMGLPFLKAGVVADAAESLRLMDQLTPYEFDRRGFKRSMRKVAAFLQERGL